VGERIEAAWAVGASQHPVEDGHGHGHGHHDHDEVRAAGAIDAVCGMTVDIEGAKGQGLHFNHAGIDYYFCGRGCRLDFEENPARYLDPAYTPSM